MPLEKLDRAVEIGDAIVEILISRAAELGQIPRPRDPIMAARVDDEAVMPMFAQLLAEVKQRRQVKIHRHAVDEDQRSIRFLIRRRQQRAV